MTRHALILCNGEPPSRSLLRRLLRRADILVAADGGANVALSAGLRPDVIVGDLDSITPAARRAFAGSLVLRVKRQDNTDLEKALDFIASQGIREAVVAGATGRRLDFTLANLSVAWLYAKRIRIRFAGDGWEAFPLDAFTRVNARRGTIVSLIPFSRCSGITLRGLRYPLTNATLSGGTVAVSNVVARNPFTVRLGSGRMLLVLLEQTGGREARS